MAKGTGNQKWDDDWYLKLPPRMKCAWGWINDNCDGAGFKMISFEKMSNEIGEPVTRGDFDKFFSDQVFWINEKEIWICDFIFTRYQSFENRARLNTVKMAVRNLEGMNLPPKQNEIFQKLTQIIRQSDDGHASVERESDDSRATVNKNKNKNKKLLKGGVGEKSDPVEFESESRLISAIPEKTHARWSKLYPDKLFVSREITKAWGYYHEEKQKPEPKTIRGWCQALSTWLERGWPKHVAQLKPGYQNSGGTSPSDPWLQEAEYALQAVKKFGPDESERIRSFLGEERFGWFVKIGGRRIRELPANEYARRDLAKMIQAVAQQAVTA